MEVQFENYGFYKIEREYLRFLNSKDSQFFFEDTEEYEKKPHLGIVVGINGMKYCIPLTSAKPRHLGWANVSKHNIVIYEMVDKSEIHRKDVCKKIGTTNTYKKIMAVLEIRKMVPVNDSLCTYIDFSCESDGDYKSLLEKEYRFLKPLKDTILKKAAELYSKQKETGIIESCYCSFGVLEAAYNEYISK
ncbi:MAG: type III toxin-antitoxin system ToxN/AbiQ family toxin [Lachnospiraceae bacterium]|nr:type III toxin-antitoxin system ToxN/AbiQ family toxin [Lachnospiraceae bacterium]